MPFANHCGCAFADDDTWRHRVSCRDPRHDRTVGDAQPVNTVDLERTVDDRHIISSHLGGAGKCQYGMIALRTKFSNSDLPRRPGKTSRFLSSRNAPELPMSRQSSTHRVAAVTSAGSLRRFVSISTGSIG